MALNNMPELILLPGLDGTGALFAPLVSALGNMCSVRHISYPGDPGLTYADLALRVREALPQRDFVLLAESFSGPVAAMVASERPSGMRALILCATFVRNPRPLAAVMSPLLGLLPISRTWARMVAPALIGAGAPRELHDLFVETVGEMPSRTVQARLRAVLKTDVSASLRKVGVPVLYLRASRDLLVPPSAGEWIRHLQPRASLVEVDGPHGLLQAAPTQSADVIRRFIESLAGPLATEMVHRYP